MDRGFSWMNFPEWKLEDKNVVTGHSPPYNETNQPRGGKKAIKHVKKMIPGEYKKKNIADNNAACGQ